jgi:PAS domain S-box-containing protein/putative nucleotidyltransferase with HDIG domain
MVNEQSTTLDRPLDVLDAVQCGVLVVDAVGRIEYANPRICEMMGRAPAELLRETLRSLYHRAPDPGRLERVLGTLGAGVEHDFFLPMADGSLRPVIVCGRPLPQEPGSPLRIVVSIQDNTLQKATETEVRAQFEDVSALSDRVLVKAMRLEDYSRELEEAVRRRTAELHEANLAAITMLAVASEAKDTGTGEHVLRIRRYAEAIARRLEFSAGDVEQIGYSAILHDVGKIQVPDSILKKPGALTDVERNEIQQHTLVGERILSNAPFFDLARQIARSHHENYDGSGYPDGLVGECIPLPARIVRVADVYDGLASRRPYKEAWPAEKTLKYIQQNSGRLFDPRVVEAFERAMEAGELT